MIENENQLKNWTEKYRPKTLSEVVGNQFLIERLKALTTTGNERLLQNFIFVGPPGVAKTTCALCLASYFLQERIKDGLLEINASDNRSIRLLSAKLKVFCEKKFTYGHKIVILDEADTLLPDTQNKILDWVKCSEYSTCFILIANSTQNFIKSFQNRFVYEYFDPITNVDIQKRLQYIAKQEGIENLDPETIDMLIYYSQSSGDLRHIILKMETIFNTYEKINQETIKSYFIRPIATIINEILQVCINLPNNQKIIKKKKPDPDQEKKKNKNNILEGENALQSIQLYRELIEPKQIVPIELISYFEESIENFMILKPHHKIFYHNILLNYKERIIQNCDVNLQFYALLCDFSTQKPKQTRK